MSRIKPTPPVVYVCVDCAIMVHRWTAIPGEPLERCCVCQWLVDNVPDTVQREELKRVLRFDFPGGSP